MQTGRIYFGFTAIGLFHSLADAVKVLTKEDFIPSGANKFFHTIAPFISLVPAIVTFAVIPFGGQYKLFGHDVNLVIADLDVGILFIFAFASLATYGVVLGGWSSNNNWSLLGGLRASAQMLSYEVAMGLTIIGVIMVFGSLKLTEIGAMQENFFRWGIFMQPLGFILFFTCAIAENKRAPFDVPEAESELVAGYFTEYSGLKFVMFWMGEFLEIVTISAHCDDPVFRGMASSLCQRSDAPFLLSICRSERRQHPGNAGQHRNLLCQGDFFHMAADDHSLDASALSL